MKHFKYKSIAAGGTFDHIHKGHRALLKRAFETGKVVIIGVTSDDFASASGKAILHNFERRKNQLRNYLAKEYPRRRYELTKLESNFGPGMFTKEIEAIVVSSETAPRVTEANKRRRELGLEDLKVEEVPMIMAQDKNKISSTRIRSGEIDTEGNVLRRAPKTSL
jgi:pantetheine-phosphate adenylyltransferase